MDETVVESRLDLGPAGRTETLIGVGCVSNFGNFGPKTANDIMLLAKI